VAIKDFAMGKVLMKRMLQATVAPCLVTGLTVTGLMVALGAAAPARAQDADRPTAFGQPMPRQYFINKLGNPSHPAAEGQPAGASDGGGASAQAAEDDTDHGPFPKRYLLNRMFHSEDFGESAAPAGPAAGSPASAPAAK
jgi:hypothetical protein